MADKEEVKEFIEGAQESLGIDIGELLGDMVKVNEEDARFRAEVMSRLDTLISNQNKIYAAVTGEGE